MHQYNERNEDHAGVAIAVRKGLLYQIIDDFESDILAIKIETDIGPIIIATIYLPPRRNYIPIGGIRALLQRNTPVYLIGDFNANHQLRGYTYRNGRGDIIADLVRRNISINEE